MNLAERFQKRLLVLANLDLHHGRFSPLAWEDTFFAAEGQLVYHPIARAEDAQLHSGCRLPNYSGRRPYAPVWIPRPCQSAYFPVADRKVTSGDDITEAAYFVRPCDEPHGWVVRSLRTRKLVVTRNVYFVRDAYTRHAQLALSDDLAGRHGSLDTAPDDYRESVRRLFAPYLDLPASSALAIDDPLSGVPVALVPALDVGQEHVLVPESAWSAEGPGPLPVLADLVQCSVHGNPRGGTPGATLPLAFTHAHHACMVYGLPAGVHSSCLPDEICAAIGAPVGTPLPRLVSHELRGTGRVCLCAHEGHRADGSAFCVSALYV